MANQTAAIATQTSGKSFGSSTVELLRGKEGNCSYLLQEQNRQITLSISYKALLQQETFNMRNHKEGGWREVSKFSMVTTDLMSGAEAFKKINAELSKINSQRKEFGESKGWKEISFYELPEFLFNTVRPSKFVRRGIVQVFPDFLPGGVSVLEVVPATTELRKVTRGAEVVVFLLILLSPGHKVPRYQGYFGPESEEISKEVQIFNMTSALPASAPD
jgi:hypothetical protein